MWSEGIWGCEPRHQQLKIHLKMWDKRVKRCCEGGEERERKSERERRGKGEERERRGELYHSYCPSAWTGPAGLTLGTAGSRQAEFEVSLLV